MNNYFNTTGEKQPQLELFVSKASKQDVIVMEIAKKQQRFSPSTIFKKYPTKILMTSLRRSINTLLNKGQIIETGEKVEGLYGRREKQYIINPKF